MYRGFGDAVGGVILSIIATEQLQYIYGENTPFRKDALADVTLSIEKGERIGIIGHTGSGKSTLVQHLNGLLQPTGGRVLLDGEDIWADPKKIRQVRFRVGLVFQYPEYQLFDDTVYKDISFGPRNMGLSEEEIDRRVKEAARMVELAPEILERSPFDLSGGQKRRAAIAGIMAMRPEVMILDEPTAGLDPKGKDTILSLIRRYGEETGATMIFVSHSMEDIALLAQKVLVMHEGRAVMFAPTEEVFAKAGQLREWGLDVPAVTRIFMGLRQRGFPVREGIYTVEDGVQEILRLQKERGQNRA